MTQEELDEMVHEAKAAEAAAINNEGKEAQIAYLISVGALPEEAAGANQES